MKMVSCFLLQFGCLYYFCLIALAITSICCWIKLAGGDILILFLILGGKYLVSLHLLWFPDGSDGKESTCNAGDPSLVKNKKCLTVFNFNVLEHFANFSYSFQNTCTPNGNSASVFLFTTVLLLLFLFFPLNTNFSTAWFCTSFQWKFWYMLVCFTQLVDLDYYLSGIMQRTLIGKHLMSNQISLAYYMYVKKLTLWKDIRKSRFRFINGLLAVLVMFLYSPINGLTTQSNLYIFCFEKKRQEEKIMGSYK